MKVKGERANVLIKLARRFGLKKICEVGVKQGQLTGNLATELPDAEIYAVDPWVFYADWPAWSDEKHKGHERTFDRVRAVFPSRIHKIKLPSVEAAKTFADGFFDLVFIDGDHSYPSVRADIDAWLPKVRRGGILSGHDYNNTEKYGNYFKGVDRAVDESFPHATIEANYVWWILVE